MLSGQGRGKAASQRSSSAMAVASRRGVLCCIGTQHLDTGPGTGYPKCFWAPWCSPCLRSPRDLQLLGLWMRSSGGSLSAPRGAALTPCPTAQLFHQLPSLLYKTQAMFHLLLGAAVLCYFCVRALAVPAGLQPLFELLGRAQTRVRRCRLGCAGCLCLSGTAARPRGFCCSALLQQRSEARVKLRIHRDGEITK